MWRNYIESIPRRAYEDGVVRIHRRGADTLLICDPQLIGEMLVDKAENFERDQVTRRAFAPSIGRNSLFLAEGAEWRWQRRAVAPIFRHEALTSFVPVFTEMADRQTAEWRAAPRGEPVDAAAAMTRTTFALIVETMLGGSANLDADRYSRAIKDSFATIPWHIIYAQLSLPEWMPYPHRRRAKRARFSAPGNPPHRRGAAQRGYDSARPPQSPAQGTRPGKRTDHDGRRGHEKSHHLHHRRP
jgi:cytochrome P450